MFRGCFAGGDSLQDSDEAERDAEYEQPVQAVTSSKPQGVDTASTGFGGSTLGIAQNAAQIPLRPQAQQPPPAARVEQPAAGGQSYAGREHRVSEDPGEGAGRFMSKNAAAAAKNRAQVSRAHGCTMTKAEGWDSDSDIEVSQF